MANLVGIYGEPGTGKSISLMNLPSEQTFYLDGDGKGMGYKGWRDKYSQEKGNYFKTTDPEKAIQSLKAIASNPKYRHIKYFVIDTVSNLMVSDEMRRAKERGYDKWVDLAISVWSLVEQPAQIREDLTVILVFHSQTERTEDGYEWTRIKTNGRKTEKNCIDSKFIWLLRSVKADGQYLLETTSHNSTSRTPLGAFEAEYISNDIRTVIEIMKEY